MARVFRASWRAQRILRHILHEAFKLSDHFRRAGSSSSAVLFRYFFWWYQSIVAHLCRKDTCSTPISPNGAVSSFERNGPIPTSLDTGGRFSDILHVERCMRLDHLDGKRKHPRMKHLKLPQTLRFLDSALKLTGTTAVKPTRFEARDGCCTNYPHASKAL